VSDSESIAFLGWADKANRLGVDRRTRHIVKSARWLLLRNKENVARPEDRVHLRELHHEQP
jgi:transposase